LTVIVVIAVDRMWTMSGDNHFKRRAVNTRIRRIGPKKTQPGTFDFSPSFAIADVYLYCLNFKS